MRKESKTRDLSLIEYLEELKLEAGSALIRKKIYPSVKDKTYWGKVVTGKLEKINSIISRNSLGDVLDENSLSHLTFPILLGKCGVPNLSYPNEDLKEDQRKLDLRHYFGSGDFKVFKGIGDEFDLISSVSLLKEKDQTSIVDINDELFEVDWRILRRIL